MSEINLLINRLADEHDDHDHDHDHDDEDNSVLIAKISAIVVLFLASLIFGTIPFKLADWFKWREVSPGTHAGSVISALLSFGGGVLLATTFLHLLPEVNEQISELQESHLLPDFQFSLSSLLMCSGFFIMYFIEELVHTYLHKHEKNNESSDTAEEAFKRGRSVRGSSLMRKKLNPDEANVVVADTENPTENTLERIHSSVPREAHHHHSHMHISKITNDDDVFVTSMRGLLVVLALSIHELFEGLAVGLQSSATNVWYMFAAVAAHKLILSFCVGVELVITKTKVWLALIYVLTFAIVSPIGIGIGILLSDNDTSSMEITAVLLQGLAAGTLLYVIFFEILSKHGRASGLLQYFMVLVGFSIMFGFQFLSEYFLIVLCRR